MLEKFELDKDATYLAGVGVRFFWRWNIIIKVVNKLILINENANQIELKTRVFDEICAFVWFPAKTTVQVFQQQKCFDFIRFGISDLLKFDKFWNKAIFVNYFFWLIRSSTGVFGWFICLTCGVMSSLKELTCVFPLYTKMGRIEMGGTVNKVCITWFFVCLIDFFVILNIICYIFFKLFGFYKEQKWVLKHLSISSVTRTASKAPGASFSLVEHIFHKIQIFILEYV